MAPVRVRVFRSEDGEWRDLCTGTISCICGDKVLVDDASGRCFEVPLGREQHRGSEKTVAIIDTDVEEYAVCFEAGDARDEFLEFLAKRPDSLDVGVGKDDVNIFAHLAKVGRCMESSVFSEMVRSKDGVVQLLEMESFHLFKMLLQSSKQVFEVLGIPWQAKVSPYAFYTEVIAKSLGRAGAAAYERFLVMLSKQELARGESNVAEMSDEEVRDFLRRCGSNNHKVGHARMYLERIYRDNEHFSQTFYYLCLVLKECMADAVDLTCIMDKIKTLARAPGDDLLYALEGLYILLGTCSPEKLNTFYMELSGLFDDVEHNPDLQRFLLHLLGAHGFRAREFVINTGLLRRVFLLGCRNRANDVFISKMLLQVVSGPRIMHRYFMENDLMRAIAEMYMGRRRDAAYSIFLQAVAEVGQDMRAYFDRYLAD